MLLLILGILLWSFGHLFKRLAQAARDGMGEAGKGLVAVAIGAGLVLMILGYRWAPVEPVWTARVPGPTGPVQVEAAQAASPFSDATSPASTRSTT